jgi:hypothetical protein
VQTHRCFLYGRRFKVSTDHAALKWLITVKNQQCVRLTWWILKLPEYEFQVMHRPGKEHVNADVLSRHVAAIVRKHDDSHDTSDVGRPGEEVALSKGVIMLEQAKEEFWQQTKQTLSEGKGVPYF